jgi:hypothetical protein
VKRVRHFTVLLMLMIMSLGPPWSASSAQAVPVTLSDGTFNPVEWMMTAETTGGAEYSVHQEVSGGNPGAFRWMVHTLPPVSPGELTEVKVTHLFQGGYYFPLLQGAINHIDYSEDSILLSLPWPDAFSTTQVALEQNGRIFQTNTTALRFIGNLSWKRATLGNLTAVDFSAADGSGDHPDFSAAGDLIHFGYTRYNSRTNTLPPVPPNDELFIEHGIDNWSVTVYPEGTSPANAPPVAKNDLAVVEVGDSNFISVLANDSDPDGDTLRVDNVSQPADGVTINSLFGILYFNDGSDYTATDEFTYTVNELLTSNPLSDTASVLILIDCGCAMTCMNTAQSAKNDPTIQISPLTNPAKGDSIDLALIYRLRDEVMRPTPHGQRYVDMYYKTTPEILKILLVDSPMLRDEAVATVELWQDNLRSLVGGDGSAIVTKSQVDAIDSFLTHLSAAASPDLQQIIATERARLGPLDDYVGLPVKEAKTQAIGIPTQYLPIIISKMGNQ